jgi:tRNA(His) guanylyltransferase
MSSKHQSLATRIKRYEAAYQYTLTPRSCLFVRIDGRAFHSFTKGCERPFDAQLMDAMEYATRQVAEDMQGFKAAYIQSDEATFMLTDFDSHETQGWFGYELNKVVSISASVFTARFNEYWSQRNGWFEQSKIATFDSRAFIVPKEDAANVFIWRQQDWMRNSVQMLAHANFSHKELHGKNIPQMHDMLHEKGINWADCNDKEKNGTFIFDVLGDAEHKKFDWGRT